MEGLQLRGRKLHTHLVNFFYTNTMLTRDCAAGLDTQLENPSTEFLGLLQFTFLVGIVKNQRVQVTVTGMKYIGDRQSVLFG